LYKREILPHVIVKKVIPTLVEEASEDSLEAASELVTIIGEKLDVKDKAFIEECFKRITLLSENKIYPSRTRFMLKNLIDLRVNKWSPRRIGESTQKIEPEPQPVVNVEVPKESVPERSAGRQVLRKSIDYGENKINDFKDSQLAAKQVLRKSMDTIPSPQKIHNHN